MQIRHPAHRRSSHWRDGHLPYSQGAGAVHDQKPLPFPVRLVYGETGAFAWIERSGESLV